MSIMYLSMVHPIIPLREWVRMGGNLTKPVIKYPIIQASQVIKFPPDLLPDRGLCGDLISLMHLIKEKNW